MEVKIANTELDILKCCDVLFELRPHLNKNDFVATVKEMVAEGYTGIYRRGWYWRCSRGLPLFAIFI